MNDRFNTAKTTDTTNEWLTPPSLIAALGSFELDPCAPRRDCRPWDMAARHFTGARDLFDGPADLERVCGLRTSWGGARVWLNPPYGDETFEWMAKLAAHRNGIALIFARTETQGFHDEVWKKANSLFFFEGRLAFYRVDGTRGDACNAPSCLVSYDDENTLAIIAAAEAGKIRGKTVFI